MAAKVPLFIAILSFFIIIIIPISQSSSSSSSSSSPQNIQTFYPFIPSPTPQTKHIPPSQQENNTHHPPSPTYRKVIKAVVATAISTVFVSTLFFFFLIKYTDNNNNNNKNKQNPNPDSNPAINNNNNTSRVEGDDADGLDTLYWNKFKGGKLRNTFNKHLVCNDFANNNTFLPLQERPLLSDTETLPLSPAPENKKKKDLAPPMPPLPPPVPPPPPAPKIATPPPPMKPPAAPLKPPARGAFVQSSSGRTENGQVKMKPLHWDKVNPQNVDHSMVWHGIEKGSFKVNADQIEALFSNRKSPKQELSSSAIDKSSQSSQIFILDPRKSQNISIVLRSLSISRREISDSLINGHGLNMETLERLTRITPTQEEQSSILEFTGDLEKLADAESFLYHLLKSVPTAFSRLNSMLFRSNYEPETLYLKESLQTLEKACNDLKTRRIFLKLLEAILKAGNRMNAGTRRGNAQAFNLTALRKLSDVKSSDGKTTLLHFIVTEVIRAEGKRCLIDSNQSSSISNQDKEREYIIMGLPVVGGLSAELGSVKKAATMEFDELAKTCPVLKARLSEIREIVRKNENSESDGFSMEMRSFLESAEEELCRLKLEQEKVMEIVKKTTDYYHGNEGNNNPLQLFVVIRDFLAMVDQTCIDITRNMQKRRISGANDTGESSLARRTVQFPQLPPNFMSDKLNDSSESDEGEEL